MPKLSLFSKVIMKDSNLDLHGPMIVREIRTPEEAEFYGSFEIMCRSLQNGTVIDFKEDELIVVEE